MTTRHCNDGNKSFPNLSAKRMYTGISLFIPHSNSILLHAGVESVA